MIVRTVLLLAAVSCAFVAMVIGFQWGWLGLNPSARRHDGFHAASLMFAALAWLPWGVWLKRYDR